MSQASSADEQLDDFMSRYEASIQDLARDAIARLTVRLPGATRLVYDNYNALVVAFSPTDRTVDCVISIALYPRWVTLFFAQGALLPDPEKLLVGSGKRIRHVVLDSAAMLETPGVQGLVDATVADQPALVDAGNPGPLVIKAIVAKQRPRTPEPKLKKATKRKS